MHRSLALLAPIFLSSLCAVAQERPAKPNVVLILTDDLGWQDVGCYDIDKPTPFETPEIDRLATQGVQFWQGYSPAPTCAPTRVAILSGKHPARSQKTHVVGGAPPSPYSARSALISPWYSGRMKLEEETLPEALAANGYTSGSVGKWHCAINHHASPTAEESGFQFSRMELGVTRKPKNRLTDFATNAEDDPYRLDENGFPRHQNSEDALTFLQQHKQDPFFLYYATWLVHTPIHTRNERLLRKYCDKMGIDFPTKPEGWPTKGQKNPHYAAMVETLDYHVGRVARYLEETDDPRWPGHKLAENTYVIFTSDNGGMERVPGEEITDNFPLDRGKISIKEGGIRVPLVIRGPGIPAGIELQTMINGLDFYPTILAWTGTEKPDGQHLDGLDLSGFLTSEGLADAPDRDTMMWHFPHSGMQSTIRKENFKLIRNWRGHLLTGKNSSLELYRLHHAKNPEQRADLNEARNLADSMPEKAQELNALLEKSLTEMEASPPFLNPNFKPALANAERIPTVDKHGQAGGKAWISFKTNDADIAKVQLIYTDNGGEKYEEWYRLSDIPHAENRAEVVLPEGATHYVWNLVDENHFLVSYPKMRTTTESKENFSIRAIKVKSEQANP